MEELEQEKEKKEESLANLVEELDQIREELSQEQSKREKEAHDSFEAIEELKHELEEAREALIQEKKRESDAKLEKALREVG